MHHLYVLTFPNGKRYIGITNNPVKRWQRHKDQARGGGQASVHRAIRRHGWDTVDRHVLVIGERDYIRDLERRAIAHFGTMDPAHGYNLTPDRDANPMDNPDIVAKMRASLTGRKWGPSAAKRASWTPERRAAVSARHKGKKLSAEQYAIFVPAGRRPEVRAKAAASTKGKTRTLEQRQRLRVARLRYLSQRAANAPTSA